MSQSFFLGDRDAVHVPFVIVKCNAPLARADKISFRDSFMCVKWLGGSEEYEPMWHAIADPFRDGDIPAGELFPAYIRKECFSRLTHTFQIEVHDRGGTKTCHSVCDIF